jgi:hypothetical protein
LICCQPVAEPHSETFCSLDAADTRSKVGVEEAIVRCLVGEPTDGSESEVDGGWRQTPNFQFVAIP